MGRAKSGLLSSFSPLITEAINIYRPGSEGWSAEVIAVELSLDARFRDIPQPSVSSIHKYLSKRGKSKRQTKHSPLPVSSDIPISTRPHKLWQMDSEGTKPVKGVDWVAQINVKDTGSTAFVMSYPCVLKTANNHPKLDDYQRTLRLAFMEWGLPEYLQTDHESIFFDNNSKSPYPTSFHLWLIGLNIDLRFTPFGKPQKQGMVERSHQTMHNQTAGRHFDTQAAMFEFCQQRRQFLNAHFPSAATKKLAPLVAHPDADFSGRHYEPEKENEIFDAVLVQNLLTKGKWYRQVAKNKRFSLGSQSYHLPQSEPNKEIVIRYNSSQNTFDCYDADGILIGHQVPKGITFKELSGELQTFEKWIKNLKLFKHRQ
jgi:hypothetical protein